MVYSYKYIITSILSGNITPQNIMQSELAESVICQHKMMLRDLFALWDIESIKNNTLQEFDRQLIQSRTTTEHGTAYDNIDYRKRADETLKENIRRRKIGYRQWILSHLNTYCNVISINTSETGTLNIAFDDKTNVPIYSRCSIWIHSYQAKFMQDFMNDENSSRKLEYPIVMNLIADSPEEAIADSHHFSVVTDGE